jgi:hypothetical protein
VKYFCDGIRASVCRYYIVVVGLPCNVLMEQVNGFGEHTRQRRMYAIFAHVSWTNTIVENDDRS